MRAKFKLATITQGEGVDVLEFSAVTDAKFDGNGVSEDNSFAKWTPTGSLKMTVTNPDLLGKFKPGQKFYLDFTPAPEPSPAS